MLKQQIEILEKQKDLIDLLQYNNHKLKQNKVIEKEILKLEKKNFFY